MGSATVLYFAVIRERVRLDEEQYALGPGCTLQGLLDQIASRHPMIEALLPICRVALNQHFTSDYSQLVTDGSEVALIPPVAGGRGDQ